MSLRGFNILVGPNNAGKSTILAAFRILAAAMRKAASRKPEGVRGPNGRVAGYTVDLTEISVAGENIFYNYDDSEPAKITFWLSNGNKLILYFPEQRYCSLIFENNGRAVSSPTTFRAAFNCPIKFVPILGPVEHNEPIFGKEAARLALSSYTASRNFRNIWYHYPEKFSDFREMLAQTWPGMDILPPSISGFGERPLLHMFCPEDRIPREIFWAGFGFQVWCQMLTHLIQSSDAALFLIDEPDIYLHSELQRQLLGILRELGPDILIATHSTEIISEAEADEIVIVNKSARSARRIKNPSDLGDVFSILGSNLNPILTQLAKTKRALFVEGDDFQILSRFARRLSLPNVANRKDFSLVPIKGFNPERIRSLKLGMEITLGGKVLAAAIMDRDYRTDAERKSIVAQCEDFCKFVTIHSCKEVENFLLVPDAIDRAASRRLSEASKRSGTLREYRECASEVLNDFAAEKKSYVLGQYAEAMQRYARLKGTGETAATITQTASEHLERNWPDESKRLQIIPGKEAVARINKHLQNEYGISITPASIIDAMRTEEIPAGMVALLRKIADFTALPSA